MIKKYNKYMNESLLDKLKGPTIEEMLDSCDNDLNKLGKKSIEIKYTDGLIYAIEHGLDIDKLNSMLTTAAIYNSYDCIKILLDCGVKFDENAVRYAFSHGYKNIVDLLFEHFNMTYTSYCINYPTEHLLISIYKDNIKETKIAIKNGANVNKLIPRPLFDAILNNKNEIAKCLIVHGAKVDDSLIENTRKMKNQEMIDFFNRYY